MGMDNPRAARLIGLDMAKMRAEGAKDLSDREIQRCLQQCVGAAS